MKDSQTAIATLQAFVNTQQPLINVLNEAIAYIQGNYDKALGEGDLKIAHDTIVSTQAQLDSVTAEKEDLHAQLQAVTTEKHNIEFQLQAVTNEKGQLAEQVDTLTTEKENLQTQVDTLSTSKGDVSVDPINTDPIINLIHK